MKNVEQLSIKKICNFYVSDIHLSVMLLPYINNEINEDVEVTTIFEKIKKDDFEEIINKLNIKNKKEILNIEWLNYNNIEEKILNNTLINNSKKNTIIIGGNKNFISNINKKIIKYIENNCDNNNEIKIIHCYNVEEVSNDMKTITKNYNEVLNTMEIIKQCC